MEPLGGRRGSATETDEISVAVLDQVIGTCAGDSSHTLFPASTCLRSFVVLLHSLFAEWRRMIVTSPVPNDSQEISDFEEVAPYCCL